MYDGKSTLEHRSNHKYKVAPNLNSFHLFSNKWTADEELKFIKGFKCLGYGNWSDVADYISTKSEAECISHFYEIYVNSKTYPLPENTELKNDQRILLNIII